MLLLRDRFRDRLWAMLTPGGNGSHQSHGGTNPAQRPQNPSVQYEPTSPGGPAPVKLLPAHAQSTRAMGRGLPSQPWPRGISPSPNTEPWAGSWHRDSCPQAALACLRQLSPSRFSTRKTSHQVFPALLLFVPGESGWSLPWAGMEGPEAGVCSSAVPTATPWHWEPSGDAAPQMDTGKV